jgi:hypothetical protein
VVRDWTQEIRLANPWRRVPNSQSVSQEILCLIWNSKLHYLLHNTLPLDHIPGQFNPIHIFPPVFSRTCPTVAHACRKRRLKWVLRPWGYYNWATQSPGDINMEIWSSRLGVGAQGYQLCLNKKFKGYRNLSNWKLLRPYVSARTKRTSSSSSSSSSSSILILIGILSSTSKGKGKGKVVPVLN